MKKGFKKEKGVVKGAPSGFVISLLVHAGAFVVAGLLVVFTVHQKEEKKFVPPKPVDRPKMKLKKPKVKVKKSAKPKSTTRIVTKVQKATMPDIQLPEMSGMSDGLAGDIGGFDIMPDLDDISVFGATTSIGSDFEGQVYSLLHRRNGGAASMGPDEFRDVLRKYVLSGWKESVLARYYRSPQKLYTTHFMVPPIPTAMAPGLFGVPEMEDYYLFVKYEGQLVHATDIKFRFWGIGDAYIFVNVDGEEVLQCSWQAHHPWFDWWTSTAAGDRTHILGNMRMVGGDWIELKAGEPVDMKVLFGEWHGGQVAGMLLVEVEGEEYPSGRNGMPLFPAFRTEKFTWDTITEISRFLAEDECSLTNGPVFNDYYSPDSDPEVHQPVVEPVVAEEETEAEQPSPVRLWTLLDGNTVEAELVTLMGRNVVLKNNRGKQVKLPIGQLSHDDRQYLTLSHPPKLDINFAKTTRPRQFGGTLNGTAPPVRGNFYTFSTRIKQASNRPYGHPLTVEYYAIGDEIGGNKSMLLDYQQSGFTLNRENDFSFELTGPEVELLDYTINNERRGKRYGGFLIVVRDSRGEVIAYNASSENLYRNYDNLRKLRVGWYFDDDCRKTLPTPPTPWADAGNN
ncbi:hypothetical protein [Pontiella sp.]|uniref:hypothetical protein n=1 Tax=Pontiella sp. TaxID=2837462 RepID=UPI0035694479